MLRNYLSQAQVARTISNISIFDLRECNTAANFIQYLSTLLVQSYRDINYLKSHFKNKTKEELKSYLENEVFPTGDDALTKNVRHGDFGEILTTDIIKSFQHHLTVPFYKLMWKLNKQKSLFCTDVFAHNTGVPLTTLFYFEVKTYTSKKRDLGVLAHDSLLMDRNSGQEAVADFLSRRYFEFSSVLESAGNQAEAERFLGLSKLYLDVVLNSVNYNKQYEIVLVREQGNFDEEELLSLDRLPPQFAGLKVTLVLILDLKEVIHQSFEMAFENIWNQISQ